MKDGDYRRVIGRGRRVFGDNNLFDDETKKRPSDYASVSYIEKLGEKKLFLSVT